MRIARTRIAKTLSPLFILTILGLGGSAGAFGIHSSRGAMLGGALSLKAPTATDFLSAPGLVGAERAAYFDAGVVRRFDLRELDISYVALGYRRGDLLLAFGAQQFGSSDLFAEQVARGAVGYRLGKLSASVTYSAKRLEFGGGYSSLTAGAIGIGWGIQTDKGALHATFDNLNEPTFSTSDPKQHRKTALFAEWTGGRSFNLSASARFEENTAPNFGLGQTVILTDYAKLSWGISSEPLVYGAGFEIRKGHITFIYAGSIHSALGYSQSLTLNVLIANPTKSKEH